MDRVLTLHAGSRGFGSHRRHMSERFFRSNRPGYPHPVSSELENSGIRVAVGDCSVTERRRWRPPYQTGKTVHVLAKHYKHNENGRTAPGVCRNGTAEPLGERRYENWNTHTHTRNKHISIVSGEYGLVDRVLAWHAGSRGFDSHRGQMSERFFRSNRPGYRHPVSFELENSGIRVAVGDCSVTERRRWRPPYQTGKTVHVHAKHYKHKEDGRTTPGVCGNGSVPLSHSWDVVTRIGIYTHIIIVCLAETGMHICYGYTAWARRCELSIMHGTARFRKLYLSGS